MPRAAPPAAKARIAVLLRMAEILAYLERLDLVHGDINSKNLAWSVVPAPVAYLIDCDGMVPASPPPITGVQSVGWTDPRVSDRLVPAHDRASDWYALALAIYRGLLLVPGQLHRKQNGTWPRPTAIPRELDGRISALLQRALTRPLHADARPKPSEWVDALRTTYLRQGGFDEKAVARLDELAHYDAAGPAPVPMPFSPLPTNDWDATVRTRPSPPRPGVPTPQTRRVPPPRPTPQPAPVTPAPRTPPRPAPTPVPPPPTTVGRSWRVPPVLGLLVTAGCGALIADRLADSSLAVQLDDTTVRGTLAVAGAIAFLALLAGVLRHRGRRRPLFGLLYLLIVCAAFAGGFAAERSRAGGETVKPPPALGAKHRLALLAAPNVHARHLRIVSVRVTGLHIYGRRAGYYHVRARRHDGWVVASALGCDGVRALRPHYALLQARGRVEAYRNFGSSPRSRLGTVTARSS